MYLRHGGAIRKSAAYRFAKQYDCMDMPAADDPSNSGGIVGGSAAVASNGGGHDDMVAMIDVKPQLRDFNAKSEYGARVLFHDSAERFVHLYFVIAPCCQ